MKSAPSFTNLDSEPFIHIHERGISNSLLVTNGWHIQASGVAGHGFKSAKRF